MKKTLFKNILRALISFGLLFWFLSKSDVNQILASFKNLSFASLAAIYSIIFLFLLVSAFKWRILIPQYEFSKLFRFTVVSAYYSLILPGQIAGEVVKIFRLGRPREDMQRITASVVFDKVTGIISLLILAILGIYFTSIYIKLIYIKILSTGVIFLLFSLFLFKYNIVRSFLEKIILWLEQQISFSKPITSFSLVAIRSFFDFSKNIYIFFASLLLGFFLQALIAYLYFFIGQQLGVYVAFSEWLWITAILSIALFFPITIGGLGVREGLLVYALGLFGVTQEKALALSLIIFSLSIIILIAGFIFDVIPDNDPKNGP